MHRIIEGLRIQTPNNEYEEDGVGTKERPFTLYASKAGILRNNSEQSLQKSVMNNTSPFSAACEMSSGTCTRKGNHEAKMQVNNRSIKLLEERLRILEDGDKILKEEFTRSMKERTELMNQLLKQFQDMQYHLRLNSQEFGEISSDGGSAIEPLKEMKRTGLMQILVRESNPLLVTRSPSARPGAIQV